jgi:hypothetical protein
MAISPYSGSNYIGLNSGATVFIGADSIRDVAGGYTYYTQYFKLTYGVTGAATPVSSSNPLPVTVASGMTATIAGFTGTITIQGTPSGTAVPVSGSLIVSGITGAPVYVRTATGVQVEVTGGRYINKTNDAISVYGPGGSTYVYVNIASTGGNFATVTNGALNVNVTGATISATIPSTVTVVGLSGATAVNVTVGNTVGINDTNILSGMTAIYSQVVGLRADLGGFAVTRPSSFKNSRVSATTVVSQLDVAGFSASSGINLKALSTNTDLIYIGNTGSFVGSSSGFAMDPGDSVFLNIVNTNKLFIQANSGTQVLTYMAS